MLDLWQPSPLWKGSDAYILGGGPSLKGFDFNFLRDKNVIGCNTAALKVGAAVCQVCFFSDEEWFIQNYDDISKFSGLVVTHCVTMKQRSEAWIKWMERKDSGLHKDGLGFGGNSGCGAINLALLLGAKRVFLLGIDCAGGPEKEHHWHADNRQQAANSEALYQKFKVGFSDIAKDLPRVFPGAEIFNLNPRSSLTVFPRLSM